MACDQAQGAAHRYVAGALSQHGLEAFEVHMLMCAECREVVRLGTAARVGLRTPVVARHSRGRTLGIGLVLAAVVVFAVQIRGDSPYGDLARITAPTFEGGAARSAADSLAAAVDRGMAAYVARDYRTAARELTVASLGDSSPGVAFYLGVSRLMRRDEHEALAALARAQEPRGNPYEAEARILVAKVWLRLGRGDSALDALGSFVSDDARTVTRVRALEDSIRKATP